jgi:predicted small lipoprotein YifL
MKFTSTPRRSLSVAIAFALAASIAGCGSKEPPPQATVATPPPAVVEQAAPAIQQAAPATQQAAAQAPTSWSAEALEDLLAPIALYPDPVLSQVLMASANPQEVLDAGNWILENQSLKGKALDDAAAAIGFTPPVRALLQFPDTLDMMCRELGWTTELGEAFIADQAGVLDAVQRLRRQAKDVGNLKSSPQMAVDTQQQAGKEVIVLQPPANTNTVYVPQYDPVAVYAPAPAATEAAPAAAAPATTTTTETKSGYSTGAMVTTGLLSFGAGMLVNELFDDDDHNHKNKYYYPNYGYGGMPYYPPYPYRPAYGNGYYPSNGYRPPPGYGGGFHNSGNIIVTNPGGGGNGYWDRYDNNRAGGVNRGDGGYRSPISSAKPNRPELSDLNNRQPRPMPANVQRPNKDAAPKQYKGNQNYAGSKDGGYKGAAKGAAGTAAANRPDARPAPKVQGSYKGAPTGGGSKVANSGYKGASKDMAKPASRPAQAPAANRPNSGNVRPPSSGGGDRGYAKPTSKPASMPSKPASMPKPQSAGRPESRPAQMPANRSGQAGGGSKQSRPSAMSGSGGGGKTNKAASQRGKQSMPQGARSKGGGGGGGKGKR